MSRLLSLNLDFVLILQSGLLILLASIAWELSRRDGRRFWFWFGGYALLQSLRTGLELAAFEQIVTPLYDLFHDLLLLSSSLALIEFARTSKTHGVNRWIYLPLLAGLTAAQLIGGEIALAWTGFATGVLGGIWAAAALWRDAASSIAALETRSSRQAGLIVVAYQLLSSLPGQFLALETPLYGVGLPLIAIRCGFVLVLTLAIFHYGIVRKNDLLSGEHASRRQRDQTVCAIVVALVGLAGWVGADLVGHNQDGTMRQQILARTQIAAAAVQAEDIRQLYWDERDLPNPAYIKLKALMISMHRANSDLRFVLLVGVRGKQAYFLADSENPESKDYSPPGQSYEEAAPKYLAGLISARPFVLGPETDRWGAWIFGDVPIVDDRGRALAFLELDIAAADWDLRIFHARLPVLLITMLIVALIFGSFRVLESLRESSSQIALSEQRNRCLVEGSPDCVQMFDRSGHYIAVNQNGLRALGRTEEEVLGQHFAALWPVEARSRIEEAIQTTVAGKPTSFEADYLTPGGQIVTWRVATNPVYDEAHRVSGFVGISVDLTKRKQAEIALVAAKKAAEEATQAKSEFLAVMSHEIRTPLSGVIGMLDLLQQSPLEPQPRGYTKFARESADTLLHLLDDALDSAKMDAGKLALEIIPFQPHEYFESAFESAAMRADAKGIAFRHEVAPSVPAVLLGDPTRLRQIISNLVNNALKFTEKGGVNVTLSAVPVGIGSIVLKIAVTDTGIGISEEARSRLFSKYAQADSSITRNYGGTGLGLSIVRSLTELMGGEVGVTSVPGQGSTFTFSAGFKVATDAVRPSRPKIPPAAPAITAAKASAAPPRARAQPAQQLRVLVVDDDASNRMVAESLITFLGHRDVVLVSSGREALDRLIAEKFDVVLMDNRMPVMDGFAATRLIRDPATKVVDPSVYIIALTANASADDRAKCLAQGMNDFITKPVRAPDMGAALARAIEFLRNRTKVPIPPAPLQPAAPAPDPAPPGLSEAELLASLDAEEAAAGKAPAGTMALNPEMFGKIAEIFLRETPRRLESMRAALAQRDAVTIGLEAHTLKSNARYLDATHLSELCARIESLADKKQLDEIEPLLRETNAVYAALSRQLHSLTA